jgi:hypothetical protein
LTQLHESILQLLFFLVQVFPLGFELQVFVLRPFSLAAQSFFGSFEDSTSGGQVKLRIVSGLVPLVFSTEREVAGKFFDVCYTYNCKRLRVALEWR